MSRIATELTELVYQALVAADCAPETGAIESVLPSKNAQQGDFQSNVCFRLSKQAKSNPRALAEKVAAVMPAHPGVVSVEVAGPGFLNFSVSDAWLGEVLCQSPDRLFRQELLRLALAKQEGVQSTAGTLLEHVPGGDAAHNNPQALVRLAGDLTTRRILCQMTPAQRAEAEKLQRAWATKVHKLRGKSYDPETADRADRESESEDDTIVLTEAQRKRQTAERARKAKKERENRVRIMETYRCKLDSLPNA